MNKLPVLIFIATLLLFYSAGKAQNIRSYSNEFLSLGVGARGLAMGTAQAASTSDATAAYWNPAGLNNLKQIELSLMHAEWFAGIAKYDYLGFAMPIADNSRFIGLSAIRLGIDDIPNTLYLVQPDGSINYNNITTFSAADYGFLLSYAQPFKKIKFGANAKIVYRQVGSFANSIGFGIDAGMQYNPNNKLMLGLTIKDLTTTFNAWKFNFTEQEKQALALTNNLIPSNSVELTGQRAILALAYKLSIGKKASILAELNTDLTFDGKRNTLIKTNVVSIDPHLGMEFGYNNFIFLRAGINNIQQQKSETSNSQILTLQPNAGIGIKIKEAQIDYALTGFNQINNGIYSHVISLKVAFGKQKSE